MNNNIGYDKIKITEFSVLSVNTSILNVNNIEYVTTTDSTQGIKMLDTATNNFIYIKMLRCKQNYKENIIDFIIKRNENSYNNKSNLYVNIPKILYNNNISNCSNKNDFERALDIAKEELESIGIIICLEDAHVNAVEVNINIELKNEFNEYREVFEFISTNTNFKGNRAKFDNNYNFHATGFTIETANYKLKFYNKSKEQKNDGNQLRIELTYKGSDILNKKFNTSKLDYFIYNMETVKADFNNFINKYIGKAVNKKIIEQQKQILILAKKIKSESSKRWVNNFISVLKSAKIDNAGINILDESEIWEVVKALDKINFARNKKNNLKHVPASWQSKNIVKLDEILSYFSSNNEELKNML